MTESNLYLVGNQFSHSWYHKSHVVITVIAWCGGIYFLMVEEAFCSLMAGGVMLLEHMGAWSPRWAVVVLTLWDTKLVMLVYHHTPSCLRRGETSHLSHIKQNTNLRWLVFWIHLALATWIFQISANSPPVIGGPDPWTWQNIKYCGLTVAGINIAFVKTLFRRLGFL